MSVQIKKSKFLSLNLNKILLFYGLKTNFLSKLTIYSMFFLLYAPHALAEQNQITISGSNSNLTITDPISVKNNKLYGESNGLIRILNGGYFHIYPGGKLTIQDLTIHIEKNSLEEPLAAFAKLEPGSTLQLKRVKIICDIKIKTAEKSYESATGQWKDVDVQYSLIGGVSSPNSGVRLEISDCIIFSKQPYSTSGISINGVSGWIEKTRFREIWSPISLENANDFRITDNSFLQNPGGNIVVSGRNILVKENEIVFPGNGYVGDGITILSHLADSIIEHNNITGGSCYGISFYETQFENVIVRKNYISEGVTNGLYITKNKMSNSSNNLLLEENYFTGNSGFGIAIDAGVSNVSLKSNYFIGNAESYGGFDVAISKNANVVISDDNLSAREIDPDWAKDLRPDRTHVNSKIKVLRF